MSIMFRAAGFDEVINKNDLNFQDMHDLLKHSHRAFGVDRNRLKAKGYGKTQLLTPEMPDTPVNRRVQVANVGATQ
jgi:hypothetical protein